MTNDRSVMTNLRFIRHSSFVICPLFLDDFLDKLDEMRAFLRLAEVGGLLVGLRPLAVLEQGDAPQGLVEDAPKGLQTDLFDHFARLLRLAGAFFTAAFGSAPAAFRRVVSPHATPCDSISYEPCLLPQKGPQTVKPAYFSRSSAGLPELLCADICGTVAPDRLAQVPRSRGSGSKHALLDQPIEDLGLNEVGEAVGACDSGRSRPS